MYTPTAKKRRVDAANATLRKPFRSPLISRPAKEAQEAESSGSVGDSSRGSGSGSTTLSEQQPAEPGVQGVTALPEPTSQQQHGSPERVHKLRMTRASLPVPPVPAFNSPSTFSARAPGGRSATNRANNDSALLALVTSQLKALEQQNRELGQSLETVRQARRIEAESRRRQRPPGPGREGSIEGKGKDKDYDEEAIDIDADLRELIGKWRAAARLAAEEVFGIAQERVRGMGGMKALRAVQREHRDFLRGGVDDAQARGGGGSGGGAPGGDGRHRHYESGEDERDGEREEDDEDDQEEADAEEDEGEGFTMLTMLKSMNIDPEALGYDEAEDGWKD